MLLVISYFISTDWACDFKEDTCGLIINEGSWTIGEQENYCECIKKYIRLHLLDKVDVYLQLHYIQLLFKLIGLDRTWAFLSFFFHGFIQIDIKALISKEQHVFVRPLKSLYWSKIWLLMIFFLTD